MRGGATAQGGLWPGRGYSPVGASVWEATAWRGHSLGGYSPGVTGQLRPGMAMAQGAAGLWKTSRKSYGKLGLKNARAKER